MFRALLADSGPKGGRFIHVLAPAAAPPALLENAVGGLPRIGCCAEVLSIQVGARVVLTASAGGCPSSLRTSLALRMSSTRVRRPAHLLASTC